MNFKSISIIFFSIILLGISCQTKKVDKETNIAFNEFLNRKFDEMLQRNPEFASSLGFKYQYGNWTDRTFSFSENELKIKKEILDSLNKFDKNSLDEQSLLSLKLFEEDIKNTEESLKWRGYAYELNQMGGVVTDLPTFLVNIHTIDTLKDALDYIHRLASYQIPFNQTIDNIEYSKSIGVFPPQFTFPYVTESIDNLSIAFNNENNNVLINDFKSKVEKLNISNTQKLELIDSAKFYIKNSVLPAHQKIGNYWSEYAKLATVNHGAWTHPKGDQYYNYCLKNNTTLDMTADEVYNLGIKEVDRIHNEMRQIMKQVHFKSDSLQEFFAFARTDKQFQYSNDDAGRKALLADATRYTDETKKKLSEIFNTLPKAPCIVMAVEKFREKSVGGAFYENPTLDGKRPGRYYVNLYNMGDNPKYQLEALTAHEAIPGHHMQIAIAQELTDIPNFRKHGGNTAYIEGWALYAEKLNKELGFYQDPYSDFGRLSMEIFRAARLVVDVGIHNKKWTREQAIDYFMKNTANAKGDVEKEIERYFLWPGQATGYKIGMIKIMELREKSKKKLGNKFDIRKFHDIILKNGSVPLNILEELILKMD